MRFVAASPVYALLLVSLWPISGRADCTDPFAQCICVGEGTARTVVLDAVVEAVGPDSQRLRVKDLLPVSPGEDVGVQVGQTVVVKEIWEETSKGSLAVGDRLLVPVPERGPLDPDDLFRLAVWAVRVDPDEHVTCEIQPEIRVPVDQAKVALRDQDSGACRDMVLDKGFEIPPCDDTIEGCALWSATRPLPEMPWATPSVLLLLVLLGVRVERKMRRSAPR